MVSTRRATRPRRVMIRHRMRTEAGESLPRRVSWVHGWESNPRRGFIGNTSVTQFGGQVAWSKLSDARRKKDIADLENGLDLVLGLRPVSYRMKEGNDRLDMGFLAQDVEALVGTEYNVLGIDEDPDRTLSLRYSDFIAPRVNAVQEQQAQIEEQRAMIEALRREVAELKAR